MNKNSFHPIIYVRGYAMTPSEIEDTVADPYMGFNIGSCKVRQLWDGTVRKYFFESPLVRLLKQFNYSDVYYEGADEVVGIPSLTKATGAKQAAPSLAPETDTERAVAYRSIVIYRYYEPSSEDLGAGLKPDMKRFATGLSDLILELRDRIYPAGAKTTISAQEAATGKPPYEQFRIYLVAHSMGGLVCRAFLQNPKLGKDEARKLVDKLFTYATPHNGIEVGILGNVPNWLALYGMNTFNRDEIADFLHLNPPQRDGENVDILTCMKPTRVFNLVGTNPGDYKVAAGLSSFAVGNASDGLVRIKNATTRARNGTGFIQSPQAFVSRSHSGYYGIVNSEEGYQNMIRFLYGDVRADGYLDIKNLTLPPKVQEQFDKGKPVKASYQIEVAVSLRGKLWQLHRRTVNENSAIFRLFDDLFDWVKSPDPVTQKIVGRAVPKPGASVMLFNVFMDMGQSQTGSSLSFAADLCVRVPQYEVEGALFFTNHYEGGYLFQNRIIVEASPPVSGENVWKVTYRFEDDAETNMRPVENLDSRDEVLTFTIPINKQTAPGISADLRVETRFWNSWQGSTAESDWGVVFPPSSSPGPGQTES